MMSFKQMLKEEKNSECRHCGTKQIFHSMLGRRCPTNEKDEKGNCVWRTTSFERKNPLGVTVRNGDK